MADVSETAVEEWMIAACIEEEIGLRDEFYAALDKQEARIARGEPQAGQDRSEDLPGEIKRRAARRAQCLHGRSQHEPERKAEMISNEQEMQDISAAFVGDEQRQACSHVPPTPDEFKEIMAGRMNISAELMEFWRRCTDKELAIWFRDPTQWSYVVRTPNGAVVADGKAERREECEEWGIRRAEEYVAENAMVVIGEGVKGPAFKSLEDRLSSGWELDFHWAWNLLGDWHFVLWPPLRETKPMLDSLDDANITERKSK